MLGQVLFSFELFMTLVTSVVITAELMLPLEVQPDVVLVPGAVRTKFAGVGALGAWGKLGIRIHDIWRSHDERGFIQLKPETNELMSTADRCSQSSQIL